MSKNSKFQKIGLFAVILACIISGTTACNSSAIEEPVVHVPYVDMPEEYPVASEGDLMYVIRATPDTIYMGYWKPKGETVVCTKRSTWPTSTVSYGQD